MAAEYLRRYGMSAEGEARLININHARRPAQYAEPVIGRRIRADPLAIAPYNANFEHQAPPHR